MIRYGTLIATVVFVCFLCATASPGGVSTVENNSKIIITVLYDDYVLKQGTQAGFGFSCLIESEGRTILFDTGSNVDMLRHNASLLNKDLGSIDTIIISHNHADHTGSLLELLGMGGNIKTYLPHSTKGTYIYNKSIEAKATVIAEKESLKVTNSIVLTGEMGGSLREQSLILDTTQGLVVIGGCSHPGIVNIVNKAKTLLGKDVYMVLGGFHMQHDSLEEIEEVVAELKTMGVKKCGPAHCTGDLGIKAFMKSFKNGYLPMGTGKIISVEGDK